jgi:hypothetical protein
VKATIVVLVIATRIRSLQCISFLTTCTKAVAIVGVCVPAASAATEEGIPRTFLDETERDVRELTVRGRTGGQGKGKGTTCIPLDLTPAPSKGNGGNSGGRNVRELTDEEEEPLDRDLRTNGNGKGKDNSQSPVSSYLVSLSYWLIRAPLCGTIVILAIWYGNLPCANKM